MHNGHFFHFVIIIIIIVIIVYFQVKIYIGTKTKLKILKSIFVSNYEAYSLERTNIKEIQEGKYLEHKSMLIELGLDISKFEYAGTDDQGNKTEYYHRDQVIKLLLEKGKRIQNIIVSKHDNPIFHVIQSSINKYLFVNNRGVSDFHLMKDIVDRNCAAQEDEINTQIPIPLYLGLVGTMIGILVGISFLWISGGLNDLLNAGNGSSGAFGVEALLGGVSLAMISSIVGILLTTFGSMQAKNAIALVEKNKHIFLSWIQAELLPNLSNDTAQTLEKMSQNLVAFNDEFSKNTSDLGNALSQVNDSYQKQTVLMQSINRLKIADIASANIEVYDKLKNSTNEIGVFAQYLQNVNEYLTTIQALNQKLDEYEKRTQVIESAGRFFAKNEKWLAESFDTANLEVKAALERFKENTKESLTKIQESLNGQILNFDNVMRLQQEKLQQTLTITSEIFIESFTNTHQNFEKAINEQQQAMHSKLQETTKLVEELKNLTHIKEGIKDFKEATNRQNLKIDELAKEIRALAQAKTIGGSIKQEITLPKWAKIFTIAGSILIASTCMFYIIPKILDWITKLVSWLF